MVGVAHGVLALSYHLGIFDEALMIEIVWLFMVCEWRVGE